MKGLGQFIEKHGPLNINLDVEPNGFVAVIDIDGHDLYFEGRHFSADQAILQALFDMFIKTTF